MLNGDSGHTGHCAVQSAEVAHDRIAFHMQHVRVQLRRQTKRITRSDADSKERSYEHIPIKGDQIRVVAHQKCSARKTGHLHA